MYEQEIEVLEQMLKEPLCRLDGICVNFLNATGQGILEASFSWEEIVKSWPKFSGNTIYPVPSTLPHQHPAKAFGFTSDMWNGAYGELRKELLQHIINELKRLDDAALTGDEAAVR